MERRSVYLDDDHYRQRVHLIQQRIGARDLDGLLILNPANLMWACGFFHIPNERPLGLYIPSHGRPLLLAAHLEKENAEENWVGDVRCYREYPGEIPAEVWMLQQIPAQKLGVDSSSHAIFLQMQALRPALRLDDTVSAMRYRRIRRFRSVRGAPGSCQRRAQRHHRTGRCADRAGRDDGQDEA
jgi:Xaa-Pro aminopeptidase